MAQELAVAEGKDVAQLGLALVRVLDALDKVPDLATSDPVDEISRRRSARRAGAQTRRPEAAGQ
jgi:hypothetical protein